MIKIGGVLAIYCLTLPSHASTGSAWDCLSGSDGKWDCRQSPAGSTTPTTISPKKQPTVEEPAKRKGDTAASSRQRTPLRPTIDTQPETTGPPRERERSGLHSPAEKPGPDDMEPSAAEPEYARPLEQTNLIDVSERIDLGLNWDRCGAPSDRERSISQSTDDVMTYIEADDAQLFQREERIQFSGRVKVNQGAQLLEAGEVRYNTRDDRLDAGGNIYFEQQGLRITGSSARFHLGKDQGQVEDVTYRLTDRMARGTAARIEIKDRDNAHLEQVSYTTCQPGNSDWLLEANRLDLDRAAGEGWARGAKLRFKGVPFAYLPFASFPIDDRRKSGFLPPSFAHRESTGVDISIPYYINIAPNRDATLTPRVTSKRGLMLAGEFRYLTTSHVGELYGEILPRDSARIQGEDKTRGAISYQGHGNPIGRWVLDTDINYVSDQDYLEDLGESLAVTSQKHLERRGDLRYRGNSWHFLGRLQHFQTVAEETTQPYARLPQLLLNLGRANQLFGLGYDLRSEYVYFDHDEKERGHRLDILPGVSLPMRRSWGYITPRLSARYTDYRLDRRAAELPASPNRTTATFSLDSGLFFERGVDWFGRRARQTLEPRLFYLYTPEKRQDELPVFDASEPDFSFANLFRKNRFNGADRVGDANQLTLALTSRSLSDLSSEELFRISLGGILYFRDREVQLSGQPIEDERSSSLVAETAARLSPGWHLRAGLQWDPHHDGGNTEKSALSLQYRGKESRILNFSYRFTDDLLEQTDISGRWPLSSRIDLVGRWNHSLFQNKTMEVFGGVEYESCCWIGRLVVRQFVTEVIDNPDLGIMIQLELKGLTSIGDRLETFLQRGILGYR